MKTLKNKAKQLDRYKQMYYNKKRNKVIQKNCGCRFQSQKIGGDAYGNVIDISTYFIFLHYNDTSYNNCLNYSCKVIFKR